MTARNGHPFGAVSTLKKYLPKRIDVWACVRHCYGMTNATWLVRYELDGVWHTCKNDNGSDIKSGSFKTACKRAREEGRAMKWAHMTAVVEEKWAHYPGEHMTAENDFRS